MDTPKQISKLGFPTKRDFLSKFKISEEKYQQANITWKELKDIYGDYLNRFEKFEQIAETVVKILLSQEAKDAGIHSVRYRIKNPESLIEKIIRKRADDQNRNITKDNYLEEITDLIGIRALHVFKFDWYNIHHFIEKTWEYKPDESPKAYHRQGDSREFISECKRCGCATEAHKKGYRSIHYIIELSPTREKFFAEIQVRTIFEEGWSEIDHKLRYISKDTKVHPLESHLAILNRIAGSADEIGTLIKRLESDILKKEYKNASESDDKDIKKNDNA